MKLLSRMAVYSLQQNTLCRIEVRFHPGIPRIEILGSSTKAIKDAALKAKLLLGQMGYRFPRNKKIYVCIDPFTQSYTGIEAAIFMAMKLSLEDNRKDVFVYGDLSFSGECTSDKTEEDILPFIPQSMDYLIGRKNLYVTDKIIWKRAKGSNPILWSETLSPLWLAALRAKLPFLILLPKGFEADPLLLDFKRVYTQLFNENLVILKDIHQNSYSVKRSDMFIATARICPCESREAWGRKTCRFSQKRCLSYVKQILKCQRLAIITELESGLISKNVSLDLEMYPINSSIQRGSANIEKLLRYIPGEQQKNALLLLKKSEQHQVFLSI